jgi:hypothetical protein
MINSQQPRSNTSLKTQLASRRKFSLSSKEHLPVNCLHVEVKEDLFGSSGGQRGVAASSVDENIDEAKSGRDLL